MPQKVYVIMGNDFPDAVFSTEEKADQFVAQKRLETEKGRIHWRWNDFWLDGEKPVERSNVPVIEMTPATRAALKEWFGVPGGYDKFHPDVVAKMDRTLSAASTADIKDTIKPQTYPPLPEQLKDFIENRAMPWREGKWTFSSNKEFHEFADLAIPFLDKLITLSSDTTDIAVELTYTNWRGETAARNIKPVNIWYGSTDWHPEPQWLLRAIDVEKQAERDFALKDFGKPSTAADMTPLLKQLSEALRAASEHLDYCGYGDNWERQCAEQQGLEKKIGIAIAAADAAGV